MMASPIYDENGNFLGTDNEGFKGDVICMNSTIYNLATNDGKGTLNHFAAMLLGRTLGEEIDALASVKKGEYGARVDGQVGIINKIINDVVSRTPEIEGYETNKLHNGSVSSIYDNRASSDEDRIYGTANDGSIGSVRGFANTEKNKISFELKSWGIKK